ncbi:MAG TPA: M15 family metallopeptidase [Rhodanobacteraceae bacterium]|nr:M15 family metallopeptidase [Rhodanobacteraceae bacterium]
MTRIIVAAIAAFASCRGATAASPDLANTSRAKSADIGPCTASPLPTSIAYMSRVMATDRQLGLPLIYPITRGMRLTPEADILVKVGYDVRGRSVRMAPRAAAALKRMIAAAARDDVQLQMVSGFRTVAYQHRLVRGKLKRGMSIDAALRINAAPGFSEHHSGCAVDLTAPGAAPADRRFAETRAYEWLQEHAGDFGFHLSYPPDNPRGIEFEPWHWRYVAEEDPTPRSAEANDTGDGSTD